jgi:hypothetical protein
VRLIATALFVALMAHPANAQDARRYVSDNAQADISICLAFYAIVADCAGSDAQSRAQAGSAMVRLGDMSLRMAKGANLPPSDAQMRFDLNMLDQRTLMGDSCSGIATLRVRYADQCGELTSKTAPQ